MIAPKSAVPSAVEPSYVRGGVSRFERLVLRGLAVVLVLPLVAVLWPFALLFAGVGVLAGWVLSRLGVRHGES